MRKLLCQFIIRRVWAMLCRPANIDNLYYGDLGQRLNILSIIPTALGGNSSWFPRDVTNDFARRVVIGINPGIYTNEYLL